MNPSEIKVSNPEISKNLENVNFCINKINFSRANQRILIQVFGKWKRYSSSSGALLNSRSIVDCPFLSNFIPSASQHFHSLLLNFKHFVIQNQKILEFCLNCLWGVLGNRPSICWIFLCWFFTNIKIPSIKQNFAVIWLFVRFAELVGTTKFAHYFLRGNETFQLFFGGAAQLFIYRW